MVLEGVDFRGYCRCPYCKTGLIIVDNQAFSCPVCELRKSRKAQIFERSTRISQEIF